MLFSPQILSVTEIAKDLNIYHINNTFAILEMAFTSRNIGGYSTQPLHVGNKSEAQDIGEGIDQVFRYNLDVETPILATKLFIPKLRTGLVPRQKLVEVFNAGLDRKLTLISTPAGFGKTTLVSECVLNCNRAVTWLSLDDQDNDKNRFLLYLIAALKVIKERIGFGVWEALHATQPLEINNLLIGLLNEITEIHQPFVLVLDDYHSITDVEIHEILIFILENQPPNLHLVISTRSDPPWPLARFRARQEMTEIRIKELRFTPQEAFSLLNGIMEIEVSMQDVMILDARIEGWVAGWQLAAISLQGRVDVSEFIKSFTSSQRFIFDYLLEEIFEELSSELQDFLLKTSILERLSAPLCDAIMGKKNSHLILDHLEQMNLFIIPMDDQRKWYRYHHLFGTLLAGRLKERYPDQISDLHQRASFWFGSNGEVWDTVRHAFAAGDVERVAQVAEVNVLEILERGELGILIRWLGELPDEIIAAYPWLRVAQAWAFAQTGLFDAAISCLSSAESFLRDTLDLSQSEKSDVSGHIAVIRCYIAIFTFGDYNKAVQLARQALNELPDSDQRTRGMVTVYLGTLQRVRRELTAALHTLNSALVIYKSQGQTYVAIDILSQIARVRREQGLLRETARVCDEAIRLADGYSKDGQHRPPVAAYAMGILGRIYYEWDRLDEALDIGTQALALSRNWGQANTLLGNHLFLGKIYQVQGRLDKALSSVLAAKETGSRFSETHEFVIGAHEMIVRLAMGEVLVVEQWVRKDSTQFDVDPNERLWELAPLIMQLYRIGVLDLLNELSAGLDNLINIFKKGGVNRRAVNAHILKAVVLQEQGELNQALGFLEQALHLAEPEGYIRSFLDQGSSMGALLKKAIAAGIEASYANQLLAALQTDVLEVAIQPGNELFSQVEILTRRETEVLRLLGTDFTIAEIASELVITTGTLRTHIKRIYRKLAVHSRFEAVTRSKELGLI